MTVNVKKEHIDLGVRGKGILCPVSIALNVHLDREKNYALCGRRIILLIQRKPFLLLHSFLLPQKAQRFVKDFEAGKEVKSLVFEVEEV